MQAIYRIGRIIAGSITIRDVWPIGMGMATRQSAIASMQVGCQPRPDRHPAFVAGPAESLSLAPEERARRHEALERCKIAGRWLLSIARAGLQGRRWQSAARVRGDQAGL
jgi:hypothetical protein